MDPRHPCPAAAPQRPRERLGWMPRAGLRSRAIGTDCCPVL